MSLNPRHFLRMAKWARRPPSDQRVKLVLAVIAIALLIWGAERIFGTPEWMKIEGMRPGKIGR